MNKWIRELSPGNIARPWMQKLIKKTPFLKYLPIFRRYAKGGDLESRQYYCADCKMFTTISRSEVCALQGVRTHADNHACELFK